MEGAMIGTVKLTGLRVEAKEFTTEIRIHNIRLKSLDSD